jgi:hypothetical protein
MHIHVQYSLTPTRKPIKLIQIQNSFEVYTIIELHLPLAYA